MSIEISAIKNDAEKAAKSVAMLKDSIENLDNMVKAFGGINLNFSSFDKSYESIKNIGTVLDSLSKGFSTIKNVGFENVMSEMASKGSVLASVYTTLNASLLSTSTAIDVQTISTNICTAATTAFSAALEFLNKNPLLAVIGAIGLVVGAFVAFGDSQENAKSETELFTEAQEKKRKELDETTKSIKDNTAASIESAKGAEIQSTILRGYVDNLKGLADENGIVSNIEQAKYYVDELNSAMPGTVELTKDGKLNWLENANAIEENIKQLERKAKVEAYYDGYVESIKNESKLRSELTLAQNNYNSELENQNRLQASFNELKEKRAEQGFLSNEEVDQMAVYQEQLTGSREKLEEYSATLESAKVAYDANKEGADLYNLAVQGLDGSIQSSAQLQVEEMTALGEKGTSTWDSLAAAREECKNRMTSADQEEREVAALSSELLNAEIINKAMVFGTSCDDMISKLKERGVTMSAEEEQQLRTSYDRWKISTEGIKNVQSAGLDTLSLMKNTAMSKMSDDEKNLLAESVKNFAEAGNNEGLGMCQKLSKALSNSKGEVNEEVKGILNDIKSSAENADNKTSIKAVEDSSSVGSAFNRIQSKLNTFGAATVSVVGIASVVKGTKYADGGFPDTGEMFIAREAGPELVGRINGKTAVANNDQIISGISSGVYNAMIGALCSSHRANTTVTAIFQVDGKQVAKQVIQAHNKEVIQTGRSPLLV